MNEGLYYADLRQFADVIDAAGGATAERVSDIIIAQMAQETASLAIRYAPKVTGELARSIRVDQGARQARVVADAPHAVFVEFGTWSHNIVNPRQGTYPIRPRNPGGVLAFPGGDGRTVFARSVQHPGIPAQQFMARAASETVEAFTEGIARVGVQLLLEER